MESWEIEENYHAILSTKMDKILIGFDENDEDKVKPTITSLRNNIYPELNYPDVFEEKELNLHKGMSFVKNPSGLNFPKNWQ